MRITNLRLVLVLLAPLLASRAASAQALVAMPPFVNFGGVAVGRTTPATPITLANTGNVDLTLGPAFLVDGANPGDFAINLIGLPALPFRLPAGRSIVFVVTFKPLALGPRSARIEIATDDPKEPRKLIPLDGTGVQVELTVDPLAIDFGKETLFTASAPRTITFRYLGGDFLNLIAAQFLGPQANWFRLPPGLALPLRLKGNGGITTIDVTATPLGLGTGTATLQFMTDDPWSPTVSIPVKVTGVGTDGLSVSPTTLDFVAGEGEKLVTLKNTAMVPLRISDIRITGTDSGEFQVSGIRDMLTVDPGMEVAIGVLYAPAYSGTHRAALIVAPDGLEPLEVKLTGNAPLLQLPYHELQTDFGDVPVGQTSDPITIGLRNGGMHPLTIKNFVSDNPEFEVRLDGFTAGLRPGDTTQFDVVFRPMSLGPRTAVVDIYVAGFRKQVATVRYKGDGFPVPTPPLATGGCSVASRRADVPAWLAAFVLLRVARGRRSRRSELGSTIDEHEPR